MSQSVRNPPPGMILTVNGGSSSIKFAMFEVAVDPQSKPVRRLSGEVENIGLPGTVLRSGTEEIPIQAADHDKAAHGLIDWIGKRQNLSAIAAVGHRVVHGGFHIAEHQIVDDKLMAELKRTQPLDLAHLPREIALIEAFGKRFKGVRQVACFDTVFHHNLPRLAQLLPIPRHYFESGVRRFGFHGLSFDYLMRELAHVAGAEVAQGRIILAHLGSGASMAAIRGGKPIDTTMAFTPTAGLVMGTRPGDLDPGLLVYLMRVEKLSPEKMDEFISRKCGLMGVSETTFDMRELEAKQATDARAADAVNLFCYQARKWIGAYAAALGGLETLVFSAGIGEHSALARAGICEGLEFLGLRIDPAKNAASSPVISTDDSRVTVRVIHTDEEIMIALAVTRILNLGRSSHE